MNVVRIGALVEGEGDVIAAPKLIHRIAQDIRLDRTLVVKPVIPAPVSRLQKGHSLEDEIDYILRRIGRQGGLLVLLDCDWENGCPKFDGPKWLQRARAARPNVPIRLVLAHKEFETWFLAAAETLRGICGLPEDLVAPESPEDVRGAKEWLNSHMPRHTPYSPVPDQAVLTSHFDMNMARRRSDSFDKCYREVSALLRELKVVGDA